MFVKVDFSANRDSIFMLKNLFFPEVFPMFDKLIDILKANPRRIVFTEGPDARILEAASHLK